MYRSRIASGWWTGLSAKPAPRPRRPAPRVRVALPPGHRPPMGWGIGLKPWYAHVVREERSLRHLTRAHFQTMAGWPPVGRAKLR